MADLRAHIVKPGLTILVLALLITLGVYGQHQYSNRNSGPNGIGSDSKDRVEDDASSPERQRTKDQDLLSAAALGDTQMVARLLDLGADLNARDNYGDTPLITATARGHAEVVNILLERGAEVNAKNGIGNTAVIEAASINRIEIVKALLTKGADVNARNIANLTALDAARRENHQALAHLLSSGLIKVTSQSQTRSPSVTGVSDLGTAASPAYNMTNVKDVADLHRAAIEGNVEKIRSVLARGANINSVGEAGWTPLLQASFHDNIAAVQFLLANNANPNATDTLGRTALIIAITRGRADIVQALLKSGADPNAKDKSGNTPMSLVQQSRQVHIGRLLKQAGVKTPTYNQVLSPP